MLPRLPRRLHGVVLLSSCALLFSGRCAADDPKPTPENTITIQLEEPVAPQKFDHPPKFWITDVTDRSGNPQPMLVTKQRGGVFLDRQPTVIVKEAMEESLKAADLLAPDVGSADLALRIYLFHFGLAEGSAFDFFGKVEFSVVVKNPKTGESQEVKAAGTSIGKRAARKKTLEKNVKQDIEDALHDAMRNFLRGEQLKSAVTALSQSASASPSPVSRPNGTSNQ